MSATLFLDDNLERDGLRRRQRPDGRETFCHRGSRLHDHAEEVHYGIVPWRGCIDLLEEEAHEVQDYERREAEIGTESNPEWSDAAVDPERERNVDESNSQGKHSDDPKVDRKLGKAIDTLDLPNTDEPPTTLLEEIAQRCR